MIDLQKLLNMISDATRAERRAYHLKLGDLVEALASAIAAGNGKMAVTTSGGGFVTNPHSYRGYYEDLALEPSSSITTIEELHAELCQRVLNKELEGYKGGDFRMGTDTPIWISPYGCSYNDAVVGYEVAGDGGIVLITKNVEH